MGEDTSLEDFLDAEDDRGEAGSAANGSAADRVTETVADGQATETDDDRGTETGDDDSGDDADAGGDDGDGALARDPESVAPASATHAWTTGGASCDACGDVVERRWRDEAGLVCGDCKDW